MQFAQHAFENPRVIRAVSALAGFCILACPLTGCRRAPDAATSAPDAPRVEKLAHGPIEIEMTLDPGRVDLRKGFLLTIAVAAPPEIDVQIPDMGDRLQGFILSGQYDGEPVDRAGKVLRRRHYRLTPVLSEEYRLAPMAIRYVDNSRSPAEQGWFPTRPIVMGVRPLHDGDPGDDISVDMPLVWVYPAPTTIALYVFLGLAAIGLLCLAIYLLKRLRRTAAQRRMSARERALRELSALMAKDLIGKDQTKDFYVELTMIVRRYIERAHAVRAPEQTTEEFLVAVSNDPRFSANVVARLRAFLEAADLVKFAAYHPQAPAVDNSVRTARQYIETDSEDEGEA